MRASGVNYRVLWCLGSESSSPVKPRIAGTARENILAYIRELNGQWRVEVARRGTRKSRTFLTEAEGRAWGNLTEARLLRRHQREQAARESALASAIPRRVLDAINDTSYAANEVAEHAIPCGTNCGVYFLVLKGEVVYVGQSVDILNRISKHRRAGKEFDAYNFIECAREDAPKVEADYIMAFMPTLNLALGRAA